jgi:hypothetical protein
MSEVIRKHPTLGIEVSSYGRVNIPATKNSKEHWTLGCINKKGYSVVMLCKKLYYVHRLIAQTFIKNENNFPLVDHIDRNKRNNHVENLRWATSKMNIDNQEKVDNALKKYGVRRCDNPKAYYKAYGIYKRRGKK